mgnify:CR=1 FL=1
MGDTMKVALPLWDGKVSTVFDFAREVVVFTINENGKHNRQSFVFADTQLMSHFQLLTKERVNVLICGAISRQLAKLVDHAGIKLHINVCGPIDKVLAAWQKGELEKYRFRCLRKCKMHGQNRARNCCHGSQKSSES